MSSSSCNILLYFGLGLMCVGSVIAFVGEDQTWEQALRSKFLFKGTFLGLKEVHTWRMLESSFRLNFKLVQYF